VRAATTGQNRGDSFSPYLFCQTTALDCFLPVVFGSLLIGHPERAKKVKITSATLERVCGLTRSTVQEATRNKTCFLLCCWWVILRFPQPLFFRLHRAFSRVEVPLDSINRSPLSRHFSSLRTCGSPKSWTPELVHFWAPPKMSTLFPCFRHRILSTGGALPSPP
jgi:hypothetical protein